MRDKGLGDEMRETAWDTRRNISFRTGFVEPEQCTTTTIFTVIKVVMKILQLYTPLLWWNKITSCSSLASCYSNSLFVYKIEIQESHIRHRLF